MIKQEANVQGRLNSLSLHTLDEQLECLFINGADLE